MEIDQVFLLVSIFDLGIRHLLNRAEHFDSGSLDRFDQLVDLCNPECNVPKTLDVGTF